MNKITIIAFLIVVIVCGGLLWKVDNQAQKIQTLSESLKTANKTISEHEANVKITEETANEYQDTISRLNADLKRLQQRPVRCYAPTSPSGGTDGSTAGSQLSGGNGIRSDWLYDFAGRCEGERIKVIGLQTFINRVWNRRLND